MCAYKRRCLYPGGLISGIKKNVLKRAMGVLIEISGVGGGGGGGGGAYNRNFTVLQISLPICLCIFHS